MTATIGHGETAVTAPLRAEHAGLLPHIEALRTTADAIGEAGDTELLGRVSAAHLFLRDHLIVHAQAEDAALYPVVESFLGNGATATMSRDHAEVVQMTGELAAAAARLARDGLSGDLARELRRLLYGLYAVVRLHFAKEEEVYLPILDAELTRQAATEMFSALHHAARTLQATAPPPQRGRGAEAVR